MEKGEERKRESMNTVFINYENSLVDREDVALVHSILNEANVIGCFRFATEQILGWDIERVIKALDMELIKELKLEGLLKYITFPPDILNNDIKYILSKMYPDKVSLSGPLLTIELYQKVLAGEAHFPKEYFMGSIGMVRMITCVAYVVEKYKSFSSVEEIYEFFLSKEGRVFLSTYKLRAPLSLLNISITNVIYELTKSEESAKFWFDYYSYSEAYAAKEKEME